MLQRLLADRFKLAIHRETRELPVYEMGVAKGGLKIAPPKGGNCITPDPGSPAAPLGSKVCGGIARRFYELTGYAITMPEFLDSLMAILGRTVIDKTGFKDRFDIDLKFDPCSAASGIGNVPAGESSARCADFSSYPSISNALRDQLGLRLESAKGPAEVLVIDHVEKPTAN
jgi:uncharacterized protein (TIGR03435 family)